MNFQEIFDNWEQDTKIDRSELGHASLQIPKLHHKYYTIYIGEKAALRKHEGDLKRLRLDKFEFYTQGHNEETRTKGWRLPAKGAVLKTEVPVYVDADPDVIELSLKVGIQQEKVEFVESIIKSLRERGFLIKNCIDFEKFKMGG